MMTESDRFIIRKCLDGRHDEFRHLISRYQSGIMAFLTGKLKDKILVEEAMQETFVRAYFNLSSLRSPEKFLSWLIGIADRVAKELLRDRKKLVSLETVKETPGQDMVEPPDYKIEEAVSMLDEPYRQVLMLRFYSGQSCEQIAETMDVPIGTVTKQLSRAYGKLRSLLEVKEG